MDLTAILDASFPPIIFLIMTILIVIFFVNLSLLKVRTKMQINSRTNIEGNKLNVYNFTFLILHLNRIIHVRKTNE